MGRISRTLCRVFLFGVLKKVFFRFRGKTFTKDASRARAAGCRLMVTRSSRAYSTKITRENAASSRQPFASSHTMLGYSIIYNVKTQVFFKKCQKITCRIFVEFFGIFLFILHNYVIFIKYYNDFTVNPAAFVSLL